MRGYPPGVYDNLPGNKCSFEPIHPIDIRAITSGSGNLQISGGSYKGTKEKKYVKNSDAIFFVSSCSSVSYHDDRDFGR